MVTNTKTSAPQSGLYPGHPGFAPEQPVEVGGVVLAAEPIDYNTERYTTQIVVRNTGDRPIQVGSHFHFFEVNRYLAFDRNRAFGCHLNIPATTAVRFEPGDEKTVEVVAYRGKRRVIGFNGLTMGYAGDEDVPEYLPVRAEAVERMRKAGFSEISEAEAEAQMKAVQKEKKIQNQSNATPKK